MATRSDFTHEWAEITRDQWNAFAYPRNDASGPRIHAMYSPFGSFGEPWSVLSAPRRDNPDERDWIINTGDGRNFGRCAPKDMRYSEICASLKALIPPVE